MEFLDNLLACFVYVVLPMIPFMFIFGPIKTIIIVFFGFLAVGWFFILQCAFDPEVFIGAGFTGGAAAISVVMYTIASLVYLALAIVRPDPDGLPPAWKPVAFYYPISEALNAIERGEYIKVEELASDLNEKGEGAFFDIPIINKMRAYAYRRKADASAAGAERHEAEAELHRKAEAYNKSKARSNVAKERSEK